MKPSHTSITSVTAIPLFGVDRNPAVRAYVTTSSGCRGVAECSLGNVDALTQEACVHYISTTARRALVGRDALDQERVDASLMVLDDKARHAFGPEPLKHALRAVSIAVLRAGASEVNSTLIDRIEALIGNKSQPSSRGHKRLPAPIVSVVFGNVSGDTELDFFEYAILPARGGGLFRRHRNRVVDELSALHRVVMSIGRIFERNGMGSRAGRAGGYSVPLDSTMNMFDWTLDAIRESGLTPNEDVALGIDLGASTLFDNRVGEYVIKSGHQFLKRGELTELLLTWMETYPISYVQDPFDQDDWSAVIQFRSTLEQRRRFAQSNSVTVALERALDEGVSAIRHAARVGSCETIVISVSGVHTVSEMIHRVREAVMNRMEVVVSCVNERASDSFGVDLAVGLGAHGLKAGSLISGDSLMRWNRLVEIEKEMQYPNYK